MDINAYIHAYINVSDFSAKYMDQNRPWQLKKILKVVRNSPY